MTSEDLARLGIDPNAISSAYYPTPPAPLPEDLASFGAGNPKAQDSSYLTAPIPQPTPQELAAVQYPADPNGLIPDQSGTMTSHQAGPQYAGQQQAPDASLNQEAPIQNSKDHKLFWDWYKQTFQVRSGDIVPPQHVYAMQLEYARATLKAKENPPPEIINANGHRFLRVGNTQPISIDDRPDKFHQLQLADGTLGQVDASTGMFTPFKDPSGQIVKGKTQMFDPLALGNQARMAQLQQQAADLSGKIANDPNASPIWGKPYADQLRSVQAQMAALQNPIAPVGGQQSQQSAPAFSQQNQPMDPASIRSAYKAGKIDRATAVGMLRQNGFQ